MKKLEKTKSLGEMIRLRPYLFYTFLYCIVAVGCFFWFGLSGTVFGTSDAQTQHIKALAYYSGYLRDGIQNILSGQFTNAFPEWSFAIGPGADVLGTFHYYCIGEPLTALSVFVPTRFIPVFYDFLILVRMYLAGLFFIPMCKELSYSPETLTNAANGIGNASGPNSLEKGLRSQEPDGIALVAGALMYAFSFWSLRYVTSHAFFLIAPIFLPLLIMGAVRIIKGKSPIVFILAVCFAALSNFYFFYILALMTGGYVIIKLFYGMRNVLPMKKRVRKLIIIGLWALLGMCMAAVLLLPQAYSFLNNPRAGMDSKNPLLFTLGYYFELPGTLLTNQGNFYGAVPPFLLALLLLFRRERKTAKAPGAGGSGCRTVKAAGEGGLEDQIAKAPSADGSEDRTDTAPGADGSEAQTDKTPGAGGSGCRTAKTAGESGLEDQIAKAPSAPGSECQTDKAPGEGSSECHSDKAFAAGGTLKESGRVLRLIYIICGIMLLFPFFGSLFAGFSHSVDRWAFVFALLNAYVVTFMWKDLLSEDQAKGKYLCLGLAVYTIICLLFPESRKNGAMAALAIHFFAILILYFFRGEKEDDRLSLQNTNMDMSPAVRAGGQGTGSEKGQEPLPPASRDGQEILPPAAGDGQEALSPASGDGQEPSVHSSHETGSQRGRNPLRMLLYRKETFLLLLIILSILLTAMWRYSPDEEGLPLKTPLADETVDRILNNETYTISSLAEADGYKGFYRYSGDTTINPGILSGVSTTAFYWSTLNPYHALFEEGLGMRNMDSNTPFNYDERTAATGISAVRYYACATSNVETPYGYTELGTSNFKADRTQTVLDELRREYGTDELTPGQMAPLKDATVNNRVYFRNDYALPLGFTYDSYVSEKDAQTLSYAEREEALLSSVILDLGEGKTFAGADLSGLQNRADGLQAESTSDVQRIPVTYEYNEDEIREREDGFFINSPGATLTLKLKGQDIDTPCEYFCEIKGMEYEYADEYEQYFGEDALYDPAGLYNRVRYKLLPGQERHRIVREHFIEPGDGHKETTLTFADNLGRKKSATYMTPYAKKYSARHGFAVNLGWSGEIPEEISISFKNPGTYRFSDLGIFAHSMTGYEDKVNRLKEDILEDESVLTDTVTGRVSLERDKILFLSVPYSEGWTAEVDGVPATPIRANYMYMALPLGKGDHAIALTYHTPYLKAGAILSIAGLVIFLAILIIMKRRKAQRSRGGI
ncbi:MAG: YfhO family protein [Lachnospiraceae bacterium]|nr:YfhO family protein [Lachnospiraceae bacterium]